ncbi:MAG: lysophospholipid acyltransferase family protein [Bacteroidales bacterium]|nr:lysophospholipid acyltransferase family protein [Bacteroidales bacterium]MBN2819022.1 lysophospholipid acyltransferase family protein [Bacteroidales bacterium]
MLTWRDKILLSPLWLISILPLSVLFVFSYGLSKLLFYVIRYRRKVVFTNLRNSFPEKSEKEIRKIAKRFYLHLCDSIFEALHLVIMDPEEVKKRYKPVNTELMEDLYARGIDVVALSSHYANWEWACSAWIQLPYRTIGIYKPLSNKVFDRFMIHLRSRYGSPVVAMKNTLRELVESRKNKELFAVYLVGDQRPMKREIHYWTKFLNQDTPMILGPEKLAKKLDLALVFIDVKQVKRGYYELEYHLLTDKPNELNDFEITERYARLVEAQIRRTPGLYLWSHKRWKHKREQHVESQEEVNE